MENWSEIQESMKADIDQLKNQMGQMFEMIVALKDVVVVQNEEAQSSHSPIFQQRTLQTHDPIHKNKANQEFPPCGLPLNYESPYEGYEDQENGPPVVNAASTKGQHEFTQVPTSHVEKVVINKSPSTTQP